ncbi:MAG: ligand-binding protein SH3 [Thiobacillus sp. SCN 65-179]|nr:MAG: ligand-binding protein SH3 [Thiobacillus sp. SCN 65-179]
MNGLIANFPPDGIVTVNRVVLKPEYSVEDLQERVAFLCENVKTYHSDTGFVGGFVALNSGQVSNFWTTFELHERSHKSETFQPLFRRALELCENGNEEIAYEMLWSGKAYDPVELEAARHAKEAYPAKA